MRRWSMRILVAPVAAVLLLAGCASPPTPPAPPTDIELDEQVESESDALWDLMRLPTGTPRPAVGTVLYSSLDTVADIQVACLQAHNLPARRVTGGYSITNSGQYTETESRVIQWTCRRQYPVDPRLTGYLSIPQALYMYDYFAKRTAPCLALEGYRVAPPPDRLAYVGLMRSGSVWNPYFTADGLSLVHSAEEQARINSRCPPLDEEPYSQYLPFD